MFTFSSFIDLLFKGHGHRYIKRIPYMTPKGRRYRYIYKVHHSHKGKHVLDPKDMQEGAKFMIHSESGKEVHAHITARLGDTVTFVYDDGAKKGQKETIHVNRLVKLLDDAVGLQGELLAQKEKLERDLKQAGKTGTEKQVNRIQMRLDKVNNQLKMYSDIFEETEEEQAETRVEIPDMSELPQEQQEKGIQTTKAEQIQRKDFLGWFKNSVVRGENGEPQEQWGAKPIRVYHGTPIGGFTEFRQDKDDGFNIFGKGFYFTEDKNIAEMYANGVDKRVKPEDLNKEVFEVFLSLQKPIDMREVVDEQQFTDLAKWSHKEQIENSKTRIERLEKKLKGYDLALQTFKVEPLENGKCNYSYNYIRDDGSIGKLEWWNESIEEAEYSKEYQEREANEYKGYIDDHKKLIAESQKVLDGKAPATFTGIYLDDILILEDESELGNWSAPRSLDDLRKMKSVLKARTKGKTYTNYANVKHQILAGIHAEPTDDLTWQDLYYMLSNAQRDRRFHQKFRAWAESAGHDGIVHRGGYSLGAEVDEHVVYIAWEPNQIKATNAKYFNPESRNIYNGEGVERPIGGTGLPIAEAVPEDNFESMPDVETVSEDNFESMPDVETVSEDNFESMPDVETESEEAETSSTDTTTQKPRKTRKQKPRKKASTPLDKPLSNDELKDVGQHVWGARKDFSGLNARDLETMNPKDIAREVKRDKLLAWRGLNEELAGGKEAGHTVSAVIMKQAIINLVKANPFKFNTVLVDSKGNKTETDSVADYMEACDFLNQSLDSCKTYEDCMNFLTELKNLCYGQKVKKFSGDESTARAEAEAYARENGGYVEQIGIETDLKAGTKTYNYEVILKQDNFEKERFNQMKNALAGQTPSDTYTQRKNKPLNKVLNYASQFGNKDAQRERRNYFIYSEYFPKPFQEALKLAIQLNGESWDSEVVKNYVFEKTKDSSNRATKPRKRPFSWIRDVNEEVVRVGGKQAVAKADAKELHAELNLKNVQYGNWMDQESRKIHTKQCHEAFYDLADILGIDVNKVSLNGRLSIGFGARGSGSASAHYESASHIINLTKFAGGGSLAHEWGHFLDNIVASVNGVQPKANSGVFLSDAHVSKGNNSLPPKLKEAVDSVMEAILYSPREVPTDSEYANKTSEVQALKAQLKELNTAYHTESDLKRKQELLEQHNNLVPVINRAVQDRRDMTQMKLGTQRGIELMAKSPSRFVSDAQAFQSNKNGYWSRAHELFARAFESYIEDELESRNRRNSYLVTGTRGLYKTGRRGERTPEGEDAQTYPQGAERARINSAMKQLIEVIKTEGMLEKAMRKFTYSATVDQLLKGLR